MQILALKTNSFMAVIITSTLFLLMLVSVMMYLSYRDLKQNH